MVVRTLKDTWSVCWRELKHFQRSRAMIFMTLVTPFIWLAFMGNMFNFSNVTIGGMHLPPSFNLTQILFGASTYLAFFTPGVIAMTTLMGGIMGGNSIVWDRRLGYLNKMLAAPISRTSVATGKIISSSIRTGIQATIIGLIAIGMGVTVETGAIGFVLSILIAMLLCLGFAGMSMAIAATLKSMDALMMVMNLLTFPLLFMSPAMFPLSLMPSWLSSVAQFNPVTYGITPIRTLFINGWTAIDWSSMLVDLGIVGLFSIAMITIATILFRRSVA
jgi:ABC-2 type transport system permease protein